MLNKLFKTKTILIIVFLFLLINLSGAITTFNYTETDLVKIEPKATDPDSEELTYYYGYPLDENGEWKTTYGSHGEYNIPVTVSDGKSNSTEEILIIVNKKDEKPSIDKFFPENDISINEGEKIDFEISASDLNNDNLFYIWLVDGIEKGNENKLKYQTGYKDSGSHEVISIVTDGIYNETKKWAVIVNDINIERILESIPDVEAQETDAISLELPDIKKYSLSYQISEPIGNDNEWLTDYNDSGTYSVKVKAVGIDYSVEEDVNVNVKNADRSPQIGRVRDLTIYENEESVIELNANDFDGDLITFSVVDAPAGAILEENLIKWKPDYDFVKKEDSVDYLLDKFNLLSKRIKFKIIAEANGKTSEAMVKIKVKDKNRPFVLEPLNDIIVNEGEEVKIFPSYQEPDNDKIYFKYSGWMNEDRYTTNFDDAGKHIVKITATDNFHTASIFVNVIVNNVNRGPVFNEVNDYEIYENDTLKIKLSATDADNDEIKFTANEMPEGSKIEDSFFTFTPDFDFALKNEKKELKIIFTADDGDKKAERHSKIIVNNKNRPPKIINFTKNQISNRNEPRNFFVKAIDPDNDNLFYFWKFGVFEKYNSTENIRRTFTSAGKKSFKVVVSDGEAMDMHEFNIEVI